jgi:DUF2911 family protein
MRYSEDKLGEFVCHRVPVVIALVLAVSASGIVQGQASRTSTTVADECTFSDGTTISFGRKASRMPESGADVWRTGEYEATAFRVSDRTIIPPMDKPIDITAGLYTLFVDASKGEPWTLIISRQPPETGTPYPGKQFDVGRTAMGFDDSWRQPVKGFKIGCIPPGQNRHPVFIYIESGRHVAYAKVQTVNTAW